jgi:ABC-type multidrug transport system fused ATPase/permease subunit
MIENIRNFELKYLRKMNYTSLNSELSQNTAYFFYTTIFLVYIYIDSSNELKAENVFPALTLINLIRFPLWFLPNVALCCVQCIVGLERIRRFLLKDELNEFAITHNDDQDYSITFKHVDLSWDKENILKDLNFKVKKNEFIASN